MTKFSTNIFLAVFFHRYSSNSKNALTLDNLVQAEGTLNTNTIPASITWRNVAMETRSHHGNHPSNRNDSVSKVKKIIDGFRGKHMESKNTINFWRNSTRKLPSYSPTQILFNPPLKMLQKKSVFLYTFFLWETRWRV